ncbi:hypothetical protein D3C72_1409350 [compost metagenome]
MRILLRSKVPGATRSSTCVKIAARTGKFDGDSSFSRRGRMRPKPEASSRNFARTLYRLPSGARTVTSGCAPLTSTFSTRCEKRTSAPWRAASRISTSSKRARCTW